MPNSTIQLATEPTRLLPILTNINEVLKNRATQRTAVVDDLLSNPPTPEELTAAFKTAVKGFDPKPGDKIAYLIDNSLWIYDNEGEWEKVGQGDIELATDANPGLAKSPNAPEEGQVAYSESNPGVGKVEGWDELAEHAVRQPFAINTPEPDASAVPAHIQGLPEYTNYLNNKEGQGSGIDVESELVNAPGGFDNWSGVAYGNGVWVAIKKYAPKAAYSTDNGLTWQETDIASNSWESVAYGNGKFVAISDNHGNPVIAISADGINWATPSVSGIAQGAWKVIRFGVINGTGYFVAVQPENGTAALRYSADGITWTAPNSMGSSYYHWGFLILQGCACGSASCHRDISHGEVQQ